ncbi:MAG: 2,5-dihydroxypyridine 5,6-dioxygenase [Clostridium sp.]|jgi:aminopeptidase
MDDLSRGCEIILKQCMGTKPGERVLILTDDNKFKIGRALYQEAKREGADAVLMVMPVMQISGQEPPPAVAAAMLAADVIICPTEESITHTNARIAAVKNGARVATMPGITEEMFSKGPIQADYEQVERLTEHYVSMLSEAKTCRIVTCGHELVLDLKGRNGIPSTGVYRQGGQSGNLPSGEAYIAPVEDGANGEILIDGSIVGVGRLKSPVILTIQNGKLTQISGPQAAAVERAIPNNTLSRTIGELGIGTNPMAAITGVILEDEKIFGSVHIAFGTNVSFGGTVKAESHIDCVTLKPSVYLDDVLVAQNGKLLFE